MTDEEFETRRPPPLKTSSYGLLDDPRTYGDGIFVGACAVTLGIIALTIGGVLFYRIVFLISKSACN